MASADTLGVRPGRHSVYEDFFRSLLIHAGFEPRLLLRFPVAGSISARRRGRLKIQEPLPD